MRRLSRWIGVIALAVLWLAAATTVRAAVAPGGRIALRQDDGDWRCVEINGETELNVRSGPGLSYSVLVMLSPGEQAQADYSRSTEEGMYTWVPLRLTDSEGWAITARITPCVTNYATGTGTDSGSTGEVVLDNVNQDGVLDRYEIAEISRSVVLLANIQSGWIEGTGTGTIITPDGLIITNAHVIEGADEVGIALLDDINEVPVYRYYGDVIGYDEDTDVALIAIHTDTDGEPVRAADLNLPYMPTTLSPHDVFRGDSIYIFGYPGIGDDYLVVTTGTIVSVENGDLNGERLPVWYRTDAEIAPGNSGGLVVDTNGEFVGIPTFVRSETETGGRLGGIRPAEVALAVALDEADLSTAFNPVPTPDATPTPSNDPIQVHVSSVAVEHGAVQQGQPGMQIDVAFTLDRWPGQDAMLSVRFYHDVIPQEPLVNLAAPPDFRDDAGVVGTSVPLTCCTVPYDYAAQVFVPYQALGLTAPGGYPLKLELTLASTDQSWARDLSWEYIVYSVP
ncbi:MAG TPA: trypsin-like peptidase domain-containing protein [Aggregatilinea sp.]|jgi:S1-C subfamily serine protease|uniref:trypsin-like peptidase domain-containing protein n=1 Tax=Aggregatilinea sp. TaxID=2806333 RepID=UPI002CC5E344|nr:trypsin-like peptidase domain-containing protein [Aggregatilinea sp.]HML24847.1 trypsin-like peptidase domain-containing protein [Aggregatilinea sp.]